MQGLKPDKVLWAKVNAVILDQNMGVVFSTFINAMSQMIVQAGIANTEDEARVKLAAMVLSPDTHKEPGALLTQLQAEIGLLNDGKWMG